MSERLVFVPRADQPTLPNPWLRLPGGLAALVAPPSDWGTAQGAAPTDRQEWWKQVATAAQAGTLDVAAATVMGDVPVLPALAPAEQRLPAWKESLVRQAESLIGKPVRSRTDLVALQAGLLQMADHLTASHEHSQSIEGRGKRQAGDYWHAINHRREPDYGNAKYWFRHVGRHPLLKDLAEVVPALAGEFTDSVQVKAHALVEGGVLDPFRFVDLVSDACRRKDRELVQFAERVQWIEMVGLMERTLEDVVG